MSGIRWDFFSKNQLRDFGRSLWEGFWPDSVKEFCPESVGEVLSGVRWRSFARNQLMDFARNQLRDFAEFQLEGLCIESIEGFIGICWRDFPQESVGGICLAGISWKILPGIRGWILPGMT